MAAASISARFAGPASGLMIRACDTGAELSCHPVPPLQRFLCIMQGGIEAEQQGSAAVGAGPLGAVALAGIRAVPGGRVIPLEEPVPATVAAAPHHLAHQTSSGSARCFPLASAAPRPPARCWHATGPVPWSSGGVSRWRFEEGNVAATERPRL